MFGMNQFHASTLSFTEWRAGVRAWNQHWPRDFRISSTCHTRAHTADEEERVKAPPVWLFYYKRSTCKLTMQYLKQGSQVSRGIEHQQISTGAGKLHQRFGRWFQVHPVQKQQVDQIAQGFYWWQLQNRHDCQRQSKFRDIWRYVQHT